MTHEIWPVTWTDWNFGKEDNDDEPITSIAAIIGDHWRVDK